MAQTKVLCGACGARIKKDDVVSCHACGADFNSLPEVALGDLRYKPQVPGERTSADDKRVYQMQFLEIGYVVPWALGDGGGGTGNILGVHRRYVVYPYPYGTATIKIMMSSGGICVSRESIPKGFLSAGWGSGVLIPVTVLESF